MTSLAIVISMIFGAMGAAAEEQTQTWHFSTNFVEKPVMFLGNDVSIINYGHTVIDGIEPGIVVIFGTQCLNFFQIGNKIKVLSQNVILVKNDSGSYVNTHEPIIVTTSRKGFGRDIAQPAVINVTAKITGDKITIAFDDRGIEISQWKIYYPVTLSNIVPGNTIYVRCMDEDFIDKRVYMQ